MNHKALSERTAGSRFIVAPASASTWVVAFARQLIPGACFKTRNAALGYASQLATAAGMRPASVKVFD